MASKEMKVFYRKIFPDVNYYLRREMKGCGTVLDLGCGRASPIKGIPGISFSVGVDSFKPYVVESKKKDIHDSYILGDIRKVRFKPESFDCVLLLDVLEHLSKGDGLKLIKKIERIARNKIIIFTTNGFVHQKGYDKNKYQVHKSGWSAKELEGLGYDVVGINGLKFLRDEEAKVKIKPKVLGHLISDLTQKTTYYFPEYSFQIFCVKNLDKNDKPQPFRKACMPGQTPSRRL